MQPGLIIQTRFLVCRGDDNGNNVIIMDTQHLDEAQAKHDAMLLGHKQFYMIMPYNDQAERDMLVETHKLVTA